MARSGPPRQGEELECLVCGTEFYVPQYEVRRGRKYCSKPCSNRGRKPFRSKIRGEKHGGWKGNAASDLAKRSRIENQERPLGRCEHPDCTKWASDRHHIDDDPGNNAATNIRQLCRRHHMEEDGRMMLLKRVALRNAKRKRKPPAACAECERVMKLEHGLCHACNERHRRAWRKAMRDICALRSRGGCDGPMDGHHIIKRVSLRKAGHPEVIWDTRNLLSICRKHHAQITNRFIHLRRDEVPPDAFTFAEEYGLEMSLERELEDE